MQTPIRNDASGRRQALRTPRFIFASSQHAGAGEGASEGAALPFAAATPRFLLGTEEARRDDGLGDDEIETSDAELPSTVERPVSTRLSRNRQSAVPERDEIPDSEDDDGSIPGDTGVSPYEPYMNEGDVEIRDMEDEYDLLFPESPTQPETKRRRVSPSPTRQRQDRRSAATGTERILSSSSPSPQEPSSTVRVPETTSEQADDTIASPPARRPPPSTPLATAASQFHSSSTRQPRFLLNPSQHHHHHNPPSSSNRPDITPSAPRPPPPPPSTNTAPPSTPRRRPHFILPLTPSRYAQNDEPPPRSRVDPLFSPSTTRTTGRPGRHRPVGPEYVPGGMAAEVRNWIFEANVTRQATQTQQQGHAQTQPGLQAESSSTQQIDTTSSKTSSWSSSFEKYHLISEIKDVATSLPSLFSRRRSGRGAGANVQLQQPAGPGHAAPTTLITPSQHACGCSKIILFGSPLAAPPGFSAQGRNAEGHLTRGDRVGIRRGVLWEMDISSLGGEEEEEDDAGQEKVGLERWLVGVDWDIFPRAAG